MLSDLQLLPTRRGLSRSDNSRRTAPLCGNRLPQALAPAPVAILRGCASLQRLPLQPTKNRL